MAKYLQLIAGIFGFAVVAASLILWNDIAIMPDEIAIRVQTGRFIQDIGMSYGLYALCPDRFQPIPWIFIPSAWLLSWAELHFTVYQFRLIAIGSLLACFAGVAFVSVRSKKPLSLLWLPAAIVGVAGSTLVYYRYEMFTYLHLLLCCTVLYNLRAQQGMLTRLTLSASLIISQMTMAYVHPQAQLFLPLTAFLTFRLLFWTRLQAIGLIVVALAFGGIAMVTHTFFDLRCAAHPGIIAFWKQMVLDTASFDIGAMMLASSEKFDAFTSAFTYNTDYKINYLLGLPSTVVEEPMIAALNQVMKFGFLLVAFTGAVLFLTSLTRLLRFVFLDKMELNKWRFDAEIFFVSIFGPIAFYYFYDSNLYFYRAHFLNVVAVLVIVIGASNMQLRRLFNGVMGAFGLIFVSIAVGSVVLNATYFLPTLLSHEGPSTSMSNEIVGSPSKIEEFAKACGIDVTQGSGIVSDVTHEVAKRYEKIYSITYLGLQMSYAKVNAAEVIRTIRPNYVLARCTEMEMTGLGWPADKTMGLLCCSRLAQ